ncbi:type II toxin-antitoxin system HicB family antitoxin [Longimicrobium sp.]|uniref:type II toxin-antitoxin system HicB family antitoxin n=1 Tax=Longimicrobium sp. TaxID=2029185 RepID=UPI003B3A7C23
MGDDSLLAHMYLRLPYTRRVGPDEDTIGESLFFAWVEELPGCESHGETADEALEWLADGISMYIGTMLEDGLEPPIPAGSTRPEHREGAIARVS